MGFACLTVLLLAHFPMSYLELFASVTLTWFATAQWLLRTPDPFPLLLSCSPDPCSAFLTVSSVSHTSLFPPTIISISLWLGPFVHSAELGGNGYVARSLQDMTNLWCRIKKMFMITGDFNQRNILHWISLIKGNIKLIRSLKISWFVHIYTLSRIIVSLSSVYSTK